MPSLQPPNAPEPPARELTVDLPLLTAETLTLVEEVVGAWGGELDRAGSGGRIALPVAAGLRHGVLEGVVSVRRLGTDRSRVELHVERESYRLQVAAVVVLLIGAAGGLFLVLAPLIAGRESVQLLPSAFIVMLAAWFLVASRIRHRNASDFLDSLAEQAHGDRERAAGPTSR